MYQRSLLTLALCAALPLTLTGCSTFRSYENELTETSNHLQTGNVSAALATLESNNKSVISDDKDLLYYMEKGELLRLNGDIDGSQRSWTSAEDKVFNTEESTGVDSNKLAGQVGSLLVNDRVRRYDGYDYEKVMLTTQKALNLLVLGDLEAARVEIKKTHQREGEIAEARDKQYLEEEKEAKEKGIEVTYKELKGYPIETLDDPAVLGLKNSYQSAFSHYLAGYVYEALGERSLASPGYRKAIELKPSTPILEAGLKGLNSRRPGNNESDVLIVVQDGMAPARSSVSIPLPIPTPTHGVIIAAVSFPIIKPDDSGSSASSLKVGSRSVPLAEITNTELMSRRSLRDDMPGIILRTSVRAIGRAVVQKQLNDQNFLVGLAAGLAGAVVEGADERTWRTLPESIRIGRLTLKQGEHQINLNGHSIPVKITDKHQVVVLRSIGSQVYLAANTNPSAAETTLSAAAETAVETK